MRVISSGSQYKVCSNDVQLNHELPAGFYHLEFQPNSGFNLTSTLPFDLHDEAIYGNAERKVDKVLNSFEVSGKNLGVMLSGPKGIGKTLTAKLLSLRAVENGIPVIIVSQYYPGIASFLEEIDQDVLVLFDEFDKTFSDLDNGEGDPQTEMLTLFDGTANGKKLFVITCNSIQRINEFLVNRPGRFHYHFRFGYPDRHEVRKYLEDNLPLEQFDQISAVEDFARKVNLNYDCLCAIAFELRQGGVFGEVIDDLNIINLKDESYSIVMTLKNGTRYSCGSYRMDLFGYGIEDARLFDNNGRYAGTMLFNVRDITYDLKGQTLTLPPERVKMEFNTWDDERDEYVRKNLDDIEIDSIKVYKEQSSRMGFNL